MVALQPIKGMNGGGAAALSREAHSTTKQFNS
jgi:hypothetical protein